MEKQTRKRKRSYAQIGTAAASFVAGISVSRNGAYVSNLLIQLTATTKKQSSEIDRQCRALRNETIVPRTPQSSFRSISNRYLHCVHGSWVARVADSNYKQWKNQSSIWAACAKGNSEEVASSDMEWLLTSHHSALMVANWVGTCGGILSGLSNPTQISADTTTKIPFIISCNSDELINSCIQSGLKAAKADDRIVVFLLEDKPRPNDHQMNILMSDPRVDKVFATNPSTVHEKLHGYPTGLKASHRWHTHLDGREATVQNRTNLLECGGITFWLAAKILGRNGELMENEGETGAGLRRKKSMNLKKNGFSCGGKMDPDEYIERLLRSKFVFSPRGFGQQNYREWEAMLAGAVPLIDAPPPTHAELYAGLPFVAVSDWSKITPQYLEDKWEEIQTRARNGEYNMRKLYFFPYWLEKLMLA